MLRKEPKPFSVAKYIYKGGKIILAVEIGCFVLSYLGWRQVNNNQDTRLYLYKNYSWLLESYYQVGERISSDNNIRQVDLAIWRKDGKI